MIHLKGENLLKKFGQKNCTKKICLEDLYLYGNIERKE